MEQLVSELAVRRGSGRTSVVCLRQPGQLGQQLIDTGQPVWFLNQPKSTWQLIHRLRRRLKELGATVLHCHNWQAFTFGALATPFSKIGRLVVTKHGTVMPQDDTWGGRICRWAARRARCPLLRTLLRLCVATGYTSGAAPDPALRRAPARWYARCFEGDRPASWRPFTDHFDIALEYHAWRQRPPVQMSRRQRPNRPPRPSPPCPRPECRG